MTRRDFQTLGMGMAMMPAGSITPLQAAGRVDCHPPLFDNGFDGWQGRAEDYDLLQLLVDRARFKNDRTALDKVGLLDQQAELKAWNLVAQWHSDYRRQVFYDNPELQHQLGIGGLIWPGQLEHAGYRKTAHEVIASARLYVGDMDHGGHDGAFKALMDSPPHRAGILDHQATELGIGVAYYGDLVFVVMYIGGMGDAVVELDGSEFRVAPAMIPPLPVVVQ